MSKFKQNKSLTNPSNSEWEENKHPRDEEGKFISISEFRYISKHENPKEIGHPAHLYARKNNDVKYNQLTHSKFITGNKKANIKMNKNPNKLDKKDSYFVPKSENGNISDFGKRKKDWKLSEEDDIKMQKYRDYPFNKNKKR